MLGPPQETWLSQIQADHVNDTTFDENQGPSQLHGHGP